MKARSARRRTIGLIATVGGALWLAAYGSLFLYPTVGSIGYLPLAFLGMAAAGMLVGVAVAVLSGEATTSRGLRADLYFALATTIGATFFALTLLGFTGDQGKAFGLFDAELLTWHGYAAFMGTMAVASVIAASTRRSVAWWAATFGAAGQAVIWILYRIWPTEFGSTQSIIGLTPLPILLFGIAWCVIGLERLRPEGSALPVFPIGVSGREADELGQT
jgi:hypothetical protein